MIKISSDSTHKRSLTGKRSVYLAWKWKSFYSSWGDVHFAESHFPSDIFQVIYWNIKFSSVQFSLSVVSDSLQPHGLQHARLLCPSPAPEAGSNSCPSSRWCHPTILSCLPLLLLPSVFPSIRFFSKESVLSIRWPKYWSFSFSISSSNEFRTDFL